MVAPTRHRGLQAPTALSRPSLVIDRVYPAVDGGRFPVKRVLGDDLIVEATVYKDGHDLIAGRLRFCAPAPGARRWRTVPLTYDVHFDLCRGSVRLDRIGRWRFTVEAWTDRFGSWRADLRKRTDGGQTSHADLVEGADLIREAAGHASGNVQAALQDAAARLEDVDETIEARAALAFDAQLARWMAVHLPAPDRTREPTEFAVDVDRPQAGFAAWYEMFPRSHSSEPGRHGTFADAARRLPELAALGFDVVYLPPIHPIGHTHRKGRNNALVAGVDDPGSPWAIGNELGGHTTVEPRLGTLQDFDRFVQVAARHELEVALDYALQCSPDHPWVREHPEWFFVRPDGTIKYAENPPKKYEDIYPLNFWCEDYPALWEACLDILRFWIARGVRTFRVDNPHTKPFAFWKWVLGEIRRDCPEVILLAEAFSRPARMRGLAKLGFSQSYTYFTWRNTAGELRDYLTELTRSEMAEYFRGNFFVNTPDILHAYLQRGGRPAFQVRLLLAATLSPLYGMYSGFELCENVPVRPGSEEPAHSEKYEIVTRDWHAPGNLNADIARINRIRREHPALQRLANLEFHTSENEQILFYRRSAPGDDLLVAVNLDPLHPQETMVHVPVAALGLGEDALFAVEDLLTGARYTWRGTRNYVRLDPAERVAHVLHVRRTEARS